MERVEEKISGLVSHVENGFISVYLNLHTSI